MCCLLWLMLDHFLSKCFVYSGSKGKMVFIYLPSLNDDPCSLEVILIPRTLITNVSTGNCLFHESKAGSSLISMRARPGLASFPWEQGLGTKLNWVINCNRFSHVFFFLACTCTRWRRQTGFAMLEPTMTLTVWQPDPARASQFVYTLFL